MHSASNREPHVYHPYITVHNKLESPVSAQPMTNTRNAVQVNGGVITTGAYTVEHAGSSVEDSQSYGTNIEFLNILSAKDYSQGGGADVVVTPTAAQIKAA